LQARDSRERRPRQLGALGAGGEALALARGDGDDGEVAQRGCGHGGDTTRRGREVNDRRIDNRGPAPEYQGEEDDGMRQAVAWAVSLVAGAALLVAAGPAQGAAKGAGRGAARTAATAQGRAAGPVVEHTVRGGDNLHLLAGYYYRDPRQWRRIWKLNRRSLRGPSLLLPGQTLRIESAPGQGWDVPYEEFLARVRDK
jgi:nucleoid-associated protein YgaU